MRCWYHRRHESVTFVSAPSLSLSPPSPRCRRRCSRCCGRHRLVAAVVASLLLCGRGRRRYRGRLGRFIIVVVGVEVGVVRSCVVARRYRARLESSAPIESY